MSSRSYALAHRRHGSFRAALSKRDLCERDHDDKDTKWHKVLKVAMALREAARGSTGQHNAVENVAMAYLGFALRCPALYEAMFVLPTDLRFSRQLRRDLQASSIRRFANAFRT